MKRERGTRGGRSGEEVKTRLPLPFKLLSCSRLRLPIAHKKPSFPCFSGGSGRERRRLAARLVDAAAPDVAHPFNNIVVAVVKLWLEDLQVAYLEP